MADTLIPAPTAATPPSGASSGTPAGTASGTTAGTPAGTPGTSSRVGGAVGLVLGGAVSVQFGAAVATMLFPRASITGVVLMRLGIAAVLLLVATRPRLHGHSRADWSVVLAFGFALALMNTLFYEAIDRIPLGPAVTIEVLGPLVLSVAAARRAASWLWALLALIGVVLLGRGGFDDLDVAGVGFALAAGVMWACYILLSARTGSRFAGAEGLALAMAVAAVLSLPLGVIGAGRALLNPVTLGLGACVALLSSLLPYTLELFALRRIPTATFAILVSLGPAIAAIAGYLVLHQDLSLIGWLAILLVVAASIGAVRTTPAR